VLSPGYSASAPGLRAGKRARRKEFPIEQVGNRVHRRGVLPSVGLVEAPRRTPSPAHPSAKIPGPPVFIVNWARGGPDANTDRNDRAGRAGLPGPDHGEQRPGPAPDLVDRQFGRTRSFKRAARSIRAGGCTSWGARREVLNVAATPARARTGATAMGMLGTAPVGGHPSWPGAGRPACGCTSRRETGGCRLAIVA
jgi:hypothetical protein